jgi:hypothetical protein
MPAPAPAAQPARASRARRRGGVGWGLVAAGTVLAVAAVALAYVWAGRDTPQAAPAEPTTQSSQPTETPSATTTPVVSAEETREQMDAFITSYIATVTSDPRAAFKQLTPAFQEASGGYEGYIGWWGKVRSAELLDITSQPSDRTVGYTVRYEMETGAEMTEQVRLQLQREGDSYLIAGEG